TSVQVIGRRVSTRATSRNVSPKTPSPTSTRQVSGQERSSRKLCPPENSGRPSQSIKTIWSVSPTGTRVISYDQAGGFHIEWIRDLVFEYGRSKIVGPQATSAVPVLASFKSQPAALRRSHSRQEAVLGLLARPRQVDGAVR